MTGATTSLPARTELGDAAELVFGFVLFTFGVLLAVGVEPVPFGLVIGGGRLGFASAGYPMVHYYAVEITG